MMRILAIIRSRIGGYEDDILQVEEANRRGKEVLAFTATDGGDRTLVFMSRESVEELQRTIQEWLDR